VIVRPKKCIWKVEEGKKRMGFDHEYNEVILKEG
jgi:hypothetical protein